MRRAGNFELWNGNLKFLPTGLMYLSFESYPRTRPAMVKSGIEFMDAITGFERGYDKPTPIVGGVIVRQADEERARVLLESVVQERLRRAEERQKQDILDRWAALVRRLLVHERIQREYNASRAPTT